MLLLRIFLLLALLSVVSKADDHTVAPLVVRAEEATAEIQAQAAGRRLLLLPTLEFRFSVAARCAADTSPETVSISVADTHTVYRYDGPESETTFETSLKIPRLQLAPLATEAFCIADDAGVEPAQSLSIRAAMTAQISLRCARDEETSIHFESVPLDIRLVCAAADIGAVVPLQDASEASF